MQPLPSIENTPIQSWGYTYVLSSPGLQRTGFSTEAVARQTIYAKLTVLFLGNGHR